MVSGIECAWVQATMTCAGVTPVYGATRARTSAVKSRPGPRMRLSKPMASAAMMIAPPSPDASASAQALSGSCTPVKKTWRGIKPR